MPDSEADDFIEKIDRNEARSEDLFDLIHKLPNGITPQKKVEIFEIIKPTITLQEIRSLSVKNGIDVYDRLIDSLVTDHIRTHG